MLQQLQQLQLKPEVQLKSQSQEQIVIQIQQQEQLQEQQQQQQQQIVEQKGTVIEIPTTTITETFDNNDPDYLARLTAWATKDERTKMFMERYNLHKGSHNPRSHNLNATNSNNEIGEERPSKTIQSSSPPPKKMQTSQTYFSVASSANKIVQEVPKPISFDNETVQLKFRDQILYWPTAAVTRGNLQDRFEIKKPILKVSVSSAKAVKIFPNIDGTYPVSGGSSYIIVNQKKKDKTTPLDTTESKLVHFLTLDRFVRGEKQRDLATKSQFIREESFEFFADNRVYYRELIGTSNLEERISFQGKWKLNENYSRVIIKYPKLSQKKLGDKFDLHQEKQSLYTGFFFPGDGSIQCERNTSLMFK